VTSVAGVAVCICLGLGGPGAGTSGGDDGNMLAAGVDGVLVAGVGDVSVTGVGDVSVAGVGDVSVAGVGDVLVGGSGVVGELCGLPCTVGSLMSTAGQLGEQPSRRLLSSSPTGAVMRAVVRCE
jgi:hypothetical protein